MQNMLENRKKAVLDELNAMNVHKRPPKWYVSFLKHRIVNKLARRELPVIATLLHFTVASLIIFVFAFAISFFTEYYKVSAILAAVGIPLLILFALLIIIVRKKEREVENICNEIIEDKIQNEWH